CEAVFHTCRPDPLLRLDRDRVASPRANQQVKRIVTVGRLVPSKGIDVLLRAMRKVKARNPAWSLELSVIGKGRLQGELTQLARELGLADHVRFLGYLPQDEAYPHLAAADVLALPFRSDPGPVVIPEGLGLGVPIIACAVDGIAELVKAGDAVRLVPPDDHDSLADALNEVLDNPALAERMSRDGRRLYEEKFRLEYWVQNVQAWLEHSVCGASLGKNA
ncbi:MAG: glycosyltransferase family 4 protein, partial [Gammaproteobacteria bacterium]